MPSQEKKEFDLLSLLTIVIPVIMKHDVQLQFATVSEMVHETFSVTKTHVTAY